VGDYTKIIKQRTTEMSPMVIIHIIHRPIFKVHVYDLPYILTLDTMWNLIDINIKCLDIFILKLLLMQIVDL
jgi:hypothetical protein